MSTVVPERRPRPGRPRTPEMDDAILSAALEHLARDGYRRMTLDGIAATAGVSKPAIYRRWSSKAEVAMAALARNIDVEPPPSADAPTRDALIALLRRLRRRLVAPNAMALVGTLLAEERQTPELIALFRAEVWHRRWNAAKEILERGKRRGEVRENADVDAAINMLVGAIYARHLSGESVPANWPERTVDTMLAGIGVPRRSRNPGRSWRQPGR